MNRLLSSAQHFFGVFSGPYFPAVGLNTEIFSVNLRIQSNCRKYGPEITINWGTCQAMFLSYIFQEINRFK